MITVLVGMIGSGKSTFCKNKALDGYIIVNDDAIVTMCHGGDYGLYEQVLKPLYKGVENFIIEKAIKLNRAVIMDRPNCSKACRTRWIDLAKQLNVDCDAVVFPRYTPHTHAERRFLSESRNKTFAKWLEIAQYHDSIWEEPSLDEGFSKISYYKGKE